MAERLRYELCLIFTALQFFTRVPVPAWVGYSPRQLNDSARHFPLVGIFVGACCALVFIAAVRWWPPSVAVTLAMIAGVLLTGGFHEDGLADACDGLGGGMSRARALEIMKDSRVGSYATLGLGLVLLLKYSALTAVSPTSVPWVMVAAHAASRFMSVSLMFELDYVREDADAKSKPIAQGLSGPSLAWAALAGLVPALAMGPAGWGAVAAAILLRQLALRLFRRRLGGYTGDCLGAAQQACEAAFYLGWLACAST